MDKINSILIIDDNVDSLRVEKLILEHEGYIVHTSINGNQALLMLNHLQSLDLILLDMQIGDMSGIEFLILLEKKFPYIIQDTPIVFLTGLDQVPPSKAVGLIQKPVDIETLIKEVRYYLH